MPVTEAMQEARREMEICNACRYCEGFCAVFPAMTLHRSFAESDLNYLANLCHGCRGCFYACQYAPPHPFGVNLPKSLAEVRNESYARYAWPAGLAGAFRRNGLVVSLAAAAAVAAILLLTMAAKGQNIFAPQAGPGAFYQVIPWRVMAGVAGAVMCYSLLALAMGAVNFWRDAGAGPVRGSLPVLAAVHDVLSLKNLGGGGHGCNDRGEAFSQSRRWLHHAMFYGFLLCFASTCTATVYDHFLAAPAPYPFFSLPVLLGVAGGIGMLAGTGGFVWLHIAGDPAPTASRLLGADFALLFLLMLSAATGLLLLALRATGAMGVVLALHLGLILALFAVLPYSRFVHGIYRSAALLRHAMERGKTA